MPGQPKTKTKREGGPYEHLRAGWQKRHNENMKLRAETLKRLKHSVSDAEKWACEVTITACNKERSLCTNAFRAINNGRDPSPEGFAARKAERETLAYHGAKWARWRAKHSDRVAEGRVSYPSQAVYYEYRNHEWIKERWMEKPEARALAQELGKLWKEQGGMCAETLVPLDWIEWTPYLAAIDPTKPIRAGNVKIVGKPTSEVIGDDPYEPEPDTP